MGKFLGKTTLIKTHTHIQGSNNTKGFFGNIEAGDVLPIKNVIYQNRSFTQKVYMTSILAKWVLRPE